MTSLKHTYEFAVLRWLCVYAERTTITTLFIYPEKFGATLYMETYEVAYMPAPRLNAVCYDADDIGILATVFMGRYASL